MRLSLLTLLSLSVLGMATAAQAQGRPEHLVLGAGVYDALKGDETAADFNLEYRSRYLVGNLRPVIGATANTDGGLYTYGGFNYDIPLVAGITVTPGIAVGNYEKHDSKDLGGHLQFRSSAELSYTMDNKSRVGAQISHISNAGIYDHNPGVESIMVNYSHAISILGPN